MKEYFSKTAKVSKLSINRRSICNINRFLAGLYVKVSKELMIVYHLKHLRYKIARIQTMTLADDPA